MRKVLFSLLLASVAASPAIAQDYQSNHQQARAARQAARAESQPAREDSRPARTERQAPQQREFAPSQQQREYAPQQRQFAPQQRENYARQSAPEYAPRQNGFNGGAGGFARQAPDYSQRFNGYNRQAAPQQVDNNAWRQQRDQARADRAAQQQDRFNGARQRFQQPPGAFQPNRVNRRPPVVSNTPSMGTQPPMPTTRRYTPAPQWNTAWRNNSRYDWRDYRNRNRSAFHLGFYYDPFGWGYQRYDIGWRMWPSYYGSNFWINDPWYYRLPYAPPGTQWVRYYDDAVLVDMWSGQVVDVIYDFFW